jgi:hypothetical protein
MHGDRGLSVGARGIKVIVEYLDHSLLGLDVRGQGCKV